MINTHKNCITVIMVMVFFILDRLLKYFFINNILANHSWFRFTTNQGIAFGISIPNELKFGFYLLLIIILLILINWLINSFKYREHLKIFCLSLIMVGAVSNIIDRFRYGAVIDFIDLKFWPVFNIADIMIVVGTLILVIQYIRIQESKNI